MVMQAYRAVVWMAEHQPPQRKQQPRAASKTAQHTASSRNHTHPPSPQVVSLSRGWWLALVLALTCTIPAMVVVFLHTFPRSFFARSVWRGVLGTGRRSRAHTGAHPRQRTVSPPAPSTSRPSASPASAQSASSTFRRRGSVAAVHFSPRSTAGSSGEPRQQLTAACATPPPVFE
jgi:hypothetical protein